LIAASGLGLDDTLGPDEAVVLGPDEDLTAEQCTYSPVGTAVPSGGCPELTRK
jgi:hypothetical protein